MLQKNFLQSRLCRLIFYASLRNSAIIKDSVNGSSELFMLFSSGTQSRNLKTAKDIMIEKEVSHDLGDFLFYNGKVDSSL
ncbi:hypothetical protein A0O34_21165 [Chryseobacterium glaciei]|uniref:Uncharacterized protein n=1 Tax=Chryseobacterium glaciei TaxID=1685010 RepID=A0A172Y1E6_9FLAO|nr:hypothetical protein A0O34_21165 [Chryseobacterium glaciei]